MDLNQYIRRRPTSGAPVTVSRSAADRGSGTLRRSPVLQEKIGEDNRYLQELCPVP